MDFLDYIAEKICRRSSPPFVKKKNTDLQSNNRETEITLFKEAKKGAQRDRKRCEGVTENEWDIERNKMLTPRPLTTVV